MKGDYKIMKKLLALILCLAMVCSLFVACEDKTDTPPVEDDPPIENKDDKDDFDFTPTPQEGLELDYDAERLHFVREFGNVMDGVGDLIEDAEEIEDEEDFFDWFADVEALKLRVGFYAQRLDDMAVPTEAEPEFTLLQSAVRAVYDAISSFELAVVAVFEEDEAAFESAVEDFIDNLELAFILWEQVLEEFFEEILEGLE